jgi:hypothetical protein
MWRALCVPRRCLSVCLLDVQQPYEGLLPGRGLSFVEADAVQSSTEWCYETYYKTSFSDSQYRR